MTHPGRNFLFSSLTSRLLATLAVACGQKTTATAVPVRPDATVVEADAALPDVAVDLPPLPPKRVHFVAVNSTVQLVNELYRECEMGWTILERQAADEGRATEIPLSLHWVNRFDSIAEFGEALAATHPVLGSLVFTTRLSLSQCLLDNPAIRAESIDAVRRVQEAGYILELNLSHHDSYPAALHDHPDFGMLGGWAHPDAEGAFIFYVQTVLTELAPYLPPGTVIYLGNEPVQELMSGYLETGNYPPGGRGAGRSFAQALVNLRAAYRAAGDMVRAWGFTPAIAPNIRPLVSDIELPGAWTLEYVHNWWLTDALIKGCNDNDFDGVCEESTGEPSYVDAVRITFYGTMYTDPAEEPIQLYLQDALPRPLARRHFDFSPNHNRFEDALVATQERYQEEIGSGVLEVGVGELGFSHASVTEQLDHFQDYLEVALSHGVTSVGIHTVFESAEFGQGEWNFHLVSRCAPCELTDWGTAFLRVVEATNFPP